MIVDGRGRLMANFSVGVHRLPVREDPSAPGSVTIGPPERLLLHPGSRVVATSGDGAVVAQAMATGYEMAPYAGPWLLLRDKGNRSWNLGPGQDTICAAVSPDGRWAAFSPPDLLYDTVAEAAVPNPPPLGAAIRFSPDGKWLATSNADGRTFEVGTWKPGPRLGTGELTGFSPDGKIALFTTPENYLRLVRVETGAEFARIECPKFSHLRAASMTADGSKILTTHDDGARVWDLCLIRAGLAEIGLDWEAPPLPPKPKPEGPLTVQIIGADLLDPNSAASRVQRVLAHLVTGNGSDAVLTLADELILAGWHGAGRTVYDAMIRRAPAAVHPRMHRGLERFRRGHWVAAVEDFRLASAGPLSCKLRGEARVRLAWAHHELGQHADAASTLAKEVEAPAETREMDEQAGLRLLLAEFFDLDGQPDLARMQREVAAKLYPNPATAANNLAWRWLVRKANCTLGDNEYNVPAAVFLARKAVDLEPGEAIYGNTHGLALYRSGRIAEAQSVLEANLARGRDTMAGWDLFPLAMCQQRLGDRKAARESYDKAVAWMKENDGKLLGDPRELADLQVEASRLLGATN